MRVLIIALILFANTFAIPPKKISNIVVRFKDSDTSSTTTSLLQKVKKSKTSKGFLTINNGAFDKIAKKHQFRNLKSTYQKFSKQKKLDEIYKKMKLENVYSIDIDETDSIDGLVQELQESGLFEYIAIPEIVSVNTTKPNDSKYMYQWMMEKENSAYSGTDATEEADLDMETAWDITTGDTSTVVAILDTGTKLTHQDLQGRIWFNKNEIPNNGIDDDNNGFIDDVNGWNFASLNDTVNDTYGHGTHVAGIIGAATNNGYGIAGMNWNCKLMTVKVLGDNGSGSTTEWHDGIIYAVDNGANVINMSLGGYVDYNGTKRYLQEAIDYAYNHGVTIVASAGNDYSEVTNYYPACFDSVICVGASTDKATKADFSNYGIKQDVLAPGEVIWSLKYDDSTSLTGMSGTSQAAPMVTGLVSLMIALNPNMSIAKITDIIKSTATDQVGDPKYDTQGYDKYYGFGLINPVAALYKTKYLITNYPPIVTSQVGIISVDEDDTLILSLQDIVASDENGDSIHITVLDGDSYTIFENSVVPNPNFNGNIIVPILVSDNFISSDTFYLSVVVTAINDKPVITGQNYFTEIVLGESFELLLDYLDYYDIDSDPDSLTVQIKSGFYTSLDNVITPDSDVVGDLNVSVVVSDGKSESEPFSYVLKVKDTTTAILCCDIKELDNSDMYVAPSPFVSTAYLHINSSEEKHIEIEIFSKNGNRALSQNDQLQSGTNIINLKNLNSLSEGVYYIVVKENSVPLFVKAVYKTSY